MNRMFIVAAAVVSIGAVGTLRADMEGLAALSFQAEKEDAVWLEGFAKAIDGQRVQGNNHRGTHPGALLARSTNDVITWETAVVPKDWKGKEMTFLWTAGLTNKDGRERFNLRVNDVERLQFQLDAGWGWIVEGKDGGRLAFAAVLQDGGADLFGYMKLTVPAQWVTPGEPLRLQIVGAGGKSRNWVTTVELGDTIQDLHSRLGRNILGEYVAEGPHLGEVRIIARPEYAGRKAVVAAGDRKLAQVAFEAADKVSKAFFPLSAETMKQPPETLRVSMDDKSVGEIDARSFARLRMISFLDEEVEFERYLFQPGKFPAASWQRPDRVQNLIGNVDLKVDFYDARMNRVTQADMPGRYGAVVSAAMPDGYDLKRYVTLCCVPRGWGSWDDRLELNSQYFPKFGLDEGTWNARKGLVDRELGELVLRTGAHDAGFAAALAGLQEIGVDATLLAYKADPIWRDRQWWVTFKDRQTAHKVTSLSSPGKPGTPAPVLREGTREEAGYTKEQVAEIDRVCAEWAKETGEPMTTLVACKGIIFFHKAYGTAPDGKPMAVTTRTPMASITKLLTGTLMMQFVDEGLVDLDASIGDYLPELRGRQTKGKITLRHLFTHTAGFETYGEWGMDYSHSFENEAGQYMPFMEPGKQWSYDGNGLSLAGKIMERLSGKCVPYLFQENLFGPLGCTDSISDNCHGSCMSTCLDMARVAQMLLQKGKYGLCQFFSEQTYKKMLPCSLAQTIGLEMEHGIGLEWEDRPLLGHAAASGAIFRIWPEKQLLIISARFRQGARHEEFSHRLRLAAKAPFLPAATSQPAVPARQVNERSSFGDNEGLRTPEFPEFRPFAGFPRNPRHQTG